MIGTEIGNQRLIIFNTKQIIFFLTFEKIVNNEITAAKSLYYFNTFTAQKMI